MRIFASGILLLVHASLRFGDSKNIPELIVRKDTITGRITSSKTSVDKPTNFVASRLGFTDIDWIDPINTYRNNYKESVSIEPDFIIPWMDTEWKHISGDPMNYDACARRLTKLLEHIKAPNFESFTPHSPRHFYTTVAAQRGWSRENRNRLGRWSQSSLMSDHYDAATCTTEGRIRTDVVHAIRNGFQPAAPFELPHNEPLHHQGTTTQKEPEPSDLPGSSTDFHRACAPKEPAVNTTLRTPPEPSRKEPLIQQTNGKETQIIPTKKQPPKKRPKAAAKITTQPKRAKGKNNFRNVTTEKEAKGSRKGTRPSHRPSRSSTNTTSKTRK